MPAPSMPPGLMDAFRKKLQFPPLPLYFNIENTKIKYDPNIDMAERYSLRAEREDFSIIKLKTSTPEG